MRAHGIKGVVRGRRVITTNPDTSLPCPDDKVNRLFEAANSRLVGQTSCGVVHRGAIGPSPMDDDFAYVPTWSGTVCVAFVIDVFARQIVGWRSSTSMKTQFVRPSRQIALQSPAGRRMRWSRQSG